MDEIKALEKSVDILCNAYRRQEDEIAAREAEIEALKTKIATLCAGDADNLPIKVLTRDEAVTAALVEMALNVGDKIYKLDLCMEKVYDVHTLGMNCMTESDKDIMYFVRNAEYRV